MKILIPIYFLLLSISAIAQYPGGLDSIEVNGRKAFIKIPVGSGPFPIMFEYHPVAEYTGFLSGLYGSGTPKRLNAGIYPYFLQGNGVDSVKYITVVIQPTGYSDDCFSDDMAINLPIIFTAYGNKIDTTKYIDGTYKYVGMVGEERGSDNIFNSITQNLSAGNCFFHADPGWIFRHIKKIYIARINDVCQYGSFANTGYANCTTKQIWYSRKSGDATIEPAMMSNIATYSPGVVQKLTTFTGLTNTQLSDTLYSINSPYSTLNIFRDLVDDTTVKPPPNYQATVYTIFPFSASAQWDPQPPQNFFDGAGVMNPKYGVTTDTTSPSNPQHKWDTSGGAPLKPEGKYFLSGNIFGTIWPGKRDIRYVVDLGGVTDLSDTTKKFSITDIYGLNGEEINHTMYFYNFGLIAREPDYLKRAWMIAREDSLMVPFDSLTTTGTTGWTSVPAHDSMRYVMIRITNSASHSSQFNELTFYGHYVGDTTGRSMTLAPPTYAGPLPTYKDTSGTFGKRMGTNLFQGLGVTSTSHDGDDRLYTGKYYFVDYTSRGVPPAYTKWTSTDVNDAWLQAMKGRGKTVHFTNQESNAYARAQGSQIDIDSSGLEPEVPTSYLIAGDFAYNFAAYYGKNPISTSLTKFTGSPANGQNLIKTYESGNEVEGHGGSYMQMFMKLSMEWDGHCGMFGVPGRTGIKNADSTMILSTPGMIDPDTSFIKTSALLAAFMRPDKKIPYQKYAAHRYLTQKDTTKGIYYSLEDQIGIRGEAPEWAFGSQVGWYNYANTFARRAYKFLPITTTLDLTEQGYGNCGQMIANTGEAASIYDIYPWIPFDGLTNLQSKAIILARMRLLMMASPFYIYNNYASSNQFGDTTNSIRLLFYAYGIAAALAGSPQAEFTVFYPGWYYQAGFYHQLKNYYVDAVLEQGGRTGRWMLKMRNAYIPDSVAYIPWLGSYNGSTLGSQTITMSSLAHQAVTKWTPSFSDTTGTFISLTPVANVLSSQTITESPVIYFAQESLANFLLIRRKKFVFK